LLALLVAAGSCSGDKSANPAVVHVALFKSPSSTALERLVPEFEKSTGIQVKLELLPYQDLKDRVEQQFLAGGSEYDVIMADCIWIPSFAARNFLAVVDTTVEQAKIYDFQDVLPALDDYLGRYPAHGPRYGVPFMSNVHMMAYRASVVSPVAQRLGIALPGTTRDSAWTWDQYLKIASEITRARQGSASKPYGTSLQARAGAWLIYEWYSELFGFVDDSSARLTGLPRFDAKAAKAMDYYASLYQAAPKEALTWGHEEETSAMCSGRTAMDATSNVELAAALLDTACAPGGLSFAYPPKGASGRSSPDMGGYGLLLSRFSKQQRAASSFLLWASGPATHLAIVHAGGSPIRASETKDAETLRKYPYLRFYNELIQDAVFRARIPQWPDLEDVLSRELTAVLRHQQTSAAATTKVAAWVSANVHP
jgi:multiple sugar transport system substrate-binding protein